MVRKETPKQRHRERPPKAQRGKVALGWPRPTSLLNEPISSRVKPQFERKRRGEG
jgi:hypothetical protein